MVRRRWMACCAQLVLFGCFVAAAVRAWPAPPSEDRAGDLLQLADQGLAELRSIAESDAASAYDLAERMVHAAQENRLSSPLASLAGEMLRHEDPFVRGMAEWAISMKVGGENNGQESVWPSKDSPDWYAAWVALDPAERVRADWVRQAVSTGIHGDAKKLAASVDAMIDRIAYTHWEYQERHYMEVHALWTARSDGTMSDALFKHHMPAPCGLRDTRSIPGTSKLVSIATGHHTFAYGPVVFVDPAWGMNNRAGISIVTPGARPQEGAMAGTPVAEGGVVDGGGLYQTPWALSETCLLASYAYARPRCTAHAGVDSNGFGLYVIDVYGNWELIHRDPLLSCTFPIPLAKRPRPPILPGQQREGSETDATCYVTDVYDGLQGVARGTIKYLRIAQHVAWPFDPERGQMDYIAGNAGVRQIAYQSWSPVRVIGTVPVEADGSASFKAPADTAIYFQALDAREMEVVRMRSMVSFKAGETRGCRGCHESEAKSPAAGLDFPLAARRPPSVPEPPAWGAERMLGYEWLVQPILDRHCVGCHGGENPDGGLDFTGVRGPDGLFQSYRTMFGVLPAGNKPARLLVSCSDRFSDSEATRPMQFGSHRSPLVEVLLRDELHTKEVQLDQPEWRALVTWVDANAPYHDGFLNKRPADGGQRRRELVQASPVP